MDPPIVPYTRQSRLVRDYTSDDDDDNNTPQVYQPRSPNLDRYLEVHSPTNVPQRTYSLNKRPEDYAHLAPRSDSLTKKSEDYLHFAPRSNGATSPRSPATDQATFSGEELEPVRPQSRGGSVQAPTQSQLDAIRKLDFSLEAIDEHSSTERSTYEPSISSSHVSHVSSQTTVPSGSLGQKMPDFFSQGVFQTVLHNPTTAHQLKLFSESRLCGENMEFLENVDKHRALLNDVAKIMFEIHRDFISPKAPTQINIPEQLLAKANKDLKLSLASTLPKLESVFVDAQNEIERLVSFDIYPRFVRHQMTKSAAKALSGDRSKYAGLGDCFVLTDPAKADSPIVFASDGFVKVTGYPRKEIIPRNCRFLQGRQTDKSSVKRLRNAIDKRQESVEILLNETKEGKPFWNLLYTTPLFDAHGDVVFFLGGQVNCSTTIHSASDILRVLALPDDVNEDMDSNVVPVVPETAKPSRGNRLLSAFRTNSKSSSFAQPRAAGMENKLLNNIEKQDLKTQMDTFYSAYSKVSQQPSYLFFALLAN